LKHNPFVIAAQIDESGNKLKELTIEILSESTDSKRMDVDIDILDNLIKPDLGSIKLTLMPIEEDRKDWVYVHQVSIDFSASDSEHAMICSETIDGEVEKYSRTRQLLILFSEERILKTIVQDLPCDG